MNRRSTLKLSFGVGLVLCATSASNCVLPFDDYPEGDVCAAGLDAGLRLRTAPDPVLRGCDAGPQADDDDDASAGAAGTDGSS